MDPSCELRKFRSASAGIRAVLAEALRKKQSGASAAELHECCTQASAHLLELKSSSRATHLAADAARRGVQQQKGMMEATHLRLQNLQYEKDHLLREIARCRAFDTPELENLGELPPAPMEGAPAAAPAAAALQASGAIGADAMAAAHAVQLARLQHETERRRELVTALGHAQQEVHQSEAALARRRARLRELPAQLAAVQAAAAPVAASLGVECAIGAGPAGGGGGGGGGGSGGSNVDADEEGELVEGS
jgi:THO complex subunit 5